MFDVKVEISLNKNDENEYKVDFTGEDKKWMELFEVNLEEYNNKVSWDTGPLYMIKRDKKWIINTEECKINEDAVRKNQQEILDRIVKRTNIQRNKQKDPQKTYVIKY